MKTGVKRQSNRENLVRERERKRECGKKRRRCRKQPKVPCPSRLCLLSHCLIGDKPGRACPARFPEKAAEKPTEFRSRRVSLESRRVAQARRGITGAFSTRPAEYPWSAHFQRSPQEYRRVGPSIPGVPNRREMRCIPIITGRMDPTSGTVAVGWG